MTSEGSMKSGNESVLPADNPLLSIDRLTVQSGTLPVIDSLELDVPAGRRVAVVGSGRGSRAALLDAICGLRSATSGSVRLNGHRLKQAFSVRGPPDDAHQPRPLVAMATPAAPRRAVSANRCSDTVYN